SFTLTFQNGPFANGATIVIDTQRTVQLSPTDIAQPYVLTFDPTSKSCGTHALAIARHNATSAGDVPQTTNLNVTVDCWHDVPAFVALSVSVDRQTAGYTVVDQCTAQSCPGWQ